MGHEITPYLVDEPTIAAFFGSKDERLIADVLAAFPDEVSKNEQSFATQIAAGAPTLEGALRAMANRETSRDPMPHAFQYGYALELLCRHLGTRIMDDEHPELAASIRVNPRGLRMTKELEWFLSLTHPPIPIPKPEDFPAVGFLSRNQAARRSAGIGDGTIDPTDPALPPWWRRWAKSLGAERDRYAAWLKRAVRERKDLIAFYY